MHQLSYSASKSLVERKLAAFAGCSTDMVLVAKEGQSVFGVISLRAGLVSPERPLRQNQVACERLSIPWSGSGTYAGSRR